MVVKKTTEFGKAAEDLLMKRNLRVSAISADIGVSASHAYNVIRGSRAASPEFVSAMALAVQATPQETLNLNMAAAKDAGFNLDIPEDW